MNAQSVQFSSEYKNVGPACAEIIDLVSTELNPDKLIELQIALSEALNNVIEHSYEEQGGLPVTIKCCVGEDNISIRIEDEGRAIPGGWAPSVADTVERSVENLDALPEGGMGMQLIDECVDEVKYERTGNGNVLTFTKFK